MCPMHGTVDVTVVMICCLTIMICRSQAHSMAQKFFQRWHVAYCSVPTSHVKEVIKTGQLVHADWTGEVKLSPDIRCAQKIVSISPTKYVAEQ